MPSGPSAFADSPAITGGSIPGLDGAPAWWSLGPEPSRIPVVIAAPHGGRDYPRAALTAMRNPASVCPRLEDRRIDEVATAVAERVSAHVLVARAPRALIDLNRAPDDIDGELFGGSLPGDAPPGAPGRRARSGLGLVPRRLPVTGEIWRAPLDRDTLAARLAGIHAPYHARLAAMLADLRARWGAVLLIDLHSMPPLPRARGSAGPQWVLGDRFGLSCDGRLVAAAFAHLAAAGQMAAHNRPYAGGWSLDRHAARAQGIHAFQIELDRACYLDSALLDRGPGFDAVVTVLAGLVARLAAETAELGHARGDWPVAAE